MPSAPLSDYALLSDCRSASLVSRDGAVDRLCFPRFDGPSLFGRLLDDDAGHWSIRASGPFRTRRRYVHQTMAVEITFLATAGAGRSAWATPRGGSDSSTSTGRC